MAILEASVAFAVTMIVLSTITTTIVTLIHRAFRTREAGLRKSLEQLFDNAIWPKLAHGLSEAAHNASTAMTQKREEFVDTMTRASYTFAATTTGSDSGGSLRRWGRMLARRLPALMGSLLNEKRLASMTTLEFAGRLAETPVGSIIVSEVSRRGSEGEKFKEIIVRSLADKYEEIGAGATEFFRRRARLLSSVVAIILAFGVNVSAIDLFQTYLGNPELRQRVMAQGEVAAASMQRALDELQDAQRDDAPPLQVQALRAEISGVSNQLASLEQTGVGLSSRSAVCSFSGGIGVEFFGRQLPLPYIVVECRSGSNSSQVVAWIFSVLLAGFLIGLGGPFWFDVFQKLSGLAGIARRFEGAARQAPAPPPAEAAAGERVHPSVRVFTEAAEARALERRPRPLLNDDGTLDRSS